MRSKCYFDLNGQDESVIVAEITKSNDVRDKVAQKFHEALGGSSNLALVKILPETEREDFSSPLTIKGIHVHKEVIKALEIVTVGGSEAGTAKLCRGLCIAQLEKLQEMIPKVLQEKYDEISPCMPPRKRCAKSE